MLAVHSCNEKHVLDSPICWPPPLKAKARTSRATDDLEGELGMDVVVAGTGSMGAPISLNLLNQGFTVGVWNRDPARLQPLLDAGAARAMDPRDGFGAPVVLSVLSDDNAVREVFLAESTLSSMGVARSVHVNLATISPVLAREAADAHAARQVGYVAAPMFGGVPLAEAGKLNLVTAGRTEDLERVSPFLDAISAGLWPVGEDAFQANVVKIAGQVLIAAAIQSLSEAASLVERAGGDGRRAMEIYTSTIMSGPVHAMYGAMIAESRFEPARFTPALGRKNVDLARRLARTNGLQLPVADLLSDLLGEVLESGLREKDWSVLAEAQRHRELSGQA